MSEIIGEKNCPKDSQGETCIVDTTLANQQSTKDDKTRLAAESQGKDKRKAFGQRFKQKILPKAPPPRLIAGKDLNSADPAHELTQYTEYTASGSSNSTGFKKAKALARKAMEDKGRLLKKRFLLEQVLGQGGMGVVYKTRDLRKVEAEDSHPYIATKVLSQDFRNHPDAFVALQQEAVKSQKLAHPNIVTVHDFDRDGNVIFMTMELMEGTPLDKLLREHQGVGLKKADVLHYFRNMCSALSYAHHRDLIHSDFKPGNIFITKENAAKVLDFGIARAASKENSKHKFDAGNLGALTPAYATLEMLQHKKPSYSDDIYALGCVLYEMLTGEHPYGKERADRALEQNLKPKRVESLTKKQWRALYKALALRKEDRIKSIDEFKEAFKPLRSPKAAIAAGLLLSTSAAATGWMMYKQHQHSLEQENIISAKLQEADECLKTRDFRCAMDNSLFVKNLSPKNSDAAKIYQTATEASKQAQLAANISKLISESSKCLWKRNFACADLKANEALSLAPQHSEALALIEKAKQGSHDQRALQFVSRIKICLSRDDIECARLFLADAMEFDSQHPKIIAISKQVEIKKQADSDAAVEEKSRIRSLIAQANRCLKNNSFDCAEAKADEVLKLDSRNTKAIQIRQESKTAKAQVKAEEKIVSKILDKPMHVSKNDTTAAQLQNPNQL